MCYWQYKVNTNSNNPDSKVKITVHVNRYLDQGVGVVAFLVDFSLTYGSGNRQWRYFFVVWVSFQRQLEMQFQPVWSLLEISLKFLLLYLNSYCSLRNSRAPNIDPKNIHKKLKFKLYCKDFRVSIIKSKEYVTCIYV